MQGADFLIAGVVILSVGVGAFRGFIREVVALVTWLVAIWVAWHFSGFLDPYLGGVLETPESKAWVARGVVLIVVLLAGAVVAELLGWLTHTAAGLSIIDRILGFVFGLTRGVVLTGFAVMLGHTLKLEHEPWWRHSTLMPYAEHVASWLRGFAGEGRALVHKAFDEAPPGR